MKRFIAIAILSMMLLLSSCDTATDLKDNDISVENGENTLNSEALSGTENYDIDKLSTVLSAVTTDSIIGIYVGDYDTDATNEAYVMTSRYQIPQGTENYVGIKLWFVKNDKATQILKEGNYYLTPQIWEFSDKKLFCIDEYTGGTVESKVFFVSGKNAYSYPDFGAKLVRASDDSSDFYALSGGSSQTGEVSFFNTGEKPYYMYFDGNFFCEYGAISIREDQLRALPGADEILTAINNGVYNISDIFYRLNGIINLNISKDTGNGTVTHENITLVASSGSVTLVPKGELTNPLVNLENSDMSRSIIESNFLNPSEFSYGGNYVASYIPDIAVYPEKFEY